MEIIRKHELKTIVRPLGKLYLASSWNQVIARLQSFFVVPQGFHLGSTFLLKTWKISERISHFLEDSGNIWEVTLEFKRSLHIEETVFKIKLSVRTRVKYYS